MNPRSFDYHAPTSVKEAVALLEEHRGDAKLLAGGQSLIPLMKLRIASPAHLIDLGGVGGLEYVKREGGQIAIGAMTRMAEIEGSELLKKSCAILSECASQIADPLVRNMATIGGNISHADPANDIPAVMLATNAELVATGPKGRRAIPASEFFVDTFTTALAEDEVLTEIRISVSRFTGGAYAKLERQTGDFAIVAVAANLHLSAEGRCKECGIALTNVGPTAIRAKRSEAALVGTKVDAAAVARASALASEDSSPVGDLRGSERYKREMVKVVAKRAISQALKRARSRSQ